jgi:hypothetical protein
MTDAHAIAAVLDSEQRRCDYIRLGDYAALGELLHPDLVHVHTRGNQDTRESYLKYVTEVIEILKVERHDLSVKVYGEAAVMSGVQISTARARRAATGQTEELVVVKTQVLQVWLHTNRWQLVAFQATALGPLPPPPPAR